MKPGWTTIALGDACEINIGRTPSRSNPAYWGPGEPWLSIADMNQGRYLSATKETVTPLAVSKAVAKPVEPGTVLLSFKLSIGKVGIAQRRMYTNEAIAALPIRNDVPIDPNYLAWALSSQNLRGLASRAAKGATLNKRTLAAVEIAVPVIDEQRRIAAVLDRADRLRAKRHATLDRLDELRQSVFLGMFGAETGAASAVLDDVAEVQGGLQLSSKRRALPVEVPYLRVANVFRGRLDLTEIKRLRASQHEIDRTRLELGDLLLVEGHGNRNEVGRCAIWSGEWSKALVHQNHLIRVRVDRSRLRPEFAETWINSAVGRRHLLRAAKTTSGLNTISTGNVKALPIPVPSMEKQEEFVRRLDGLARLRQETASQEDVLGKLFASLQTRAFAGHL